MKARRGFTIPEMLTALVLFSIVGTNAAFMFVLAWQYYQTASSSETMQVSAQASIARFVQEMRESDVHGLYVNGSHNAVVFVSARNATDVTQTDSTPASPTYGQPLWQKWVCYYLIPPSGSTTGQWLRMEGNPTGSTFGTATIPSSIPTDVQFEQSGIKAKMLLAKNVQTFDLEDEDGDASNLNSPLMLQIILTNDSGSAASTFNPGATGVFDNASFPGNWVPITLQN